MIQNSVDISVCLVIAVFLAEDDGFIDNDGSVIEFQFHFAHASQKDGLFYQVQAVKSPLDQVLRDLIDISLFVQNDIFDDLIGKSIRFFRRRIC